jgi:hypothetical protein
MEYIICLQYLKYQKSDHQEACNEDINTVCVSALAEGQKRLNVELLCKSAAICLTEHFNEVGILDTPL